MLSSEPTSSTDLTHQMDMFSFGCILVELFSDTILFNLSDLLHYKQTRKRDRVQPIIDSIHVEELQPVITNLTDLNPMNRKAASHILLDLKGTLFPPYFDSLYAITVAMTKMSPDSRMLFLSKELETLFPEIQEECPEGVTILLHVITSSLRSLKHLHCKLIALKMLVTLVKGTQSVTSHLITDRLIPYLVTMLTLEEEECRVRGEAIHTITRLLEMVQVVPVDDNNIFTDYLMDSLRVGCYDAIFW